MNYLFFYSARFEGMTEGIRYVCRDRREATLVATGSESRSRGSIREAAKEALQCTDTDAIDLFFAE